MSEFKFTAQVSRMKRRQAGSDRTRLCKLSAREREVA